uniref:hypothetical protein n=1 Tax=Pseudomonas viridiflava TaxID=33069 RepID=UPI00197E6D17
VWGELKKTRPKKAEHAPIEYPYLTFSNNLMEATTWDGFEALYTLWKQEHGVKPNAAAESKRLEQQKARQAEREARRVADEEAEKVRAQRIYAERMAYEHTWLTGERSEFEYEGTRKDGSASCAFQPGP